MKILILFTILIVTLFSCVADKNLLTSVEIPDWSNRNDTILYRQMPVAVFTHYEIELYKGDEYKEICLSALNEDTMDLEKQIIRYVHTVHPDDKVQFRPRYRD
jgi:hypothetical protein